MCCVTCWAITEEKECNLIAALCETSCQMQSGKFGFKGAVCDSMNQDCLHMALNIEVAELAACS